MEINEVSVSIQNIIYEIRGQKVILDRDLAGLYGVNLKALNQAVKRNIERFPSDFMFQLTRSEWDYLRSQFATANKKISKMRYLPYVFTEHGVLMLSNVLNSRRAINMSIQIIVRGLHPCTPAKGSIGLIDYSPNSGQNTNTLGPIV